MRSKVHFIPTLLILCLGPAAHPQDAQPAPLNEQLKAQYTTLQTCGAQGTVLTFQKPGITGVPELSPVTWTWKYQNGKLQPPPSKKLHDFLGRIPGVPAPPAQTTKVFVLGQKVYPTHIDVNVSNDTVTLGIVACDTHYKANVEFHYDKGTLQKTGVPAVVDEISQILAFDQPSDPPPPDPQAQAQIPQATPDPPAEPPKIQLGQSVEEVVAALGQPDKIADLGSKKIFTYKNLKITFKDGKVVDAE